MGNNGKELAELAASAGASIAIKDALQRWVESDNNDTLQEILRQLGVTDETAIMAVAAVAGYGGKWAVRLALKLHSDPVARARAKRIAISTGKVLKAGFVDNRGPTGVLYRLPEE